MVENLYQSLSATVLRKPNNIALIFDGHEYSYGQFYQQVKRNIAGLIEQVAAQKGDVIVLAFGNRPEFCALFYAAQALGVIVVPLSTKLKADDSEALLKEINAKAVFYDPHYQPWLANNRHSKAFSLSDWSFVLRNIDNQALSYKLPAVSSTDTAVIMYTSGTTGKPKGAVISQQNILSAVNAYHQVLQLSENDSTILAVPICHITGLSALLCLFIHLGGKIYLLNRFNSEEILRIVDDYQISFLHGSPTVFILLIQEALRKRNSHYASLRMIACGAGHLNEGVIKQLAELFPKAEIRPIYGLTETSSPASISPHDVRNGYKLGSSGQPIPHLVCEIRDDDNHPLALGEPGHLWLKGPVVVKQYWQNSQANQQAFADGWFYTGDIACLDEDNYLYIKDRSKDMINRGGEKIYSIEIENLLSTYDGVKDVAIIPKPSDLYGEEAVAFIVAHQDKPLIRDNIIDWLTGRIAKYKIPAEIIFVAELPKNVNGKTDKIQLRKTLVFH